MGLSSHNIDRLDIISRNSYNPNQRSTTAPGLMSRSTGDHSQRTMGIGIGTTGGNASGGAGGEDRPGPPNPSAGDALLVDERRGRRAGTMQSF